MSYTIWVLSLKARPVSAVRAVATAPHSDLTDQWSDLSDHLLETLISMIDQFLLSLFNWFIVRLSIYWI